MTQLTSRRRRLGVLAAAAVTATLVTGLAQLPAVGDPAQPTERTTPDLITLGDSPAGLSDLDTRGSVQPTAAQKTAAGRLGATVRWNQFGTPASILPADGSLGRTSSGDTAVAARAWLRSHAAALGIS